MNTVNVFKRRVRRRSLTLLVVLPLGVAAVLLASCGSPNSLPGPTGTLKGTLRAVGGPAGDGPRALSGEVTLNGSGGHITSIAVGPTGRFSVPVSVGTYIVSGLSPKYEGGASECHASGPITVTQGATIRIQVDCQEK